MTPDADATTPPAFLESTPWPGGVVELVYGAKAASGQSL